MSSCLSGSGRTYGFDLDIVKPLSSSSASGRSFHSSSPSSTLSETSNSPRTISIKKARTPRKRPNQTYNEAAALLSTIYPNVFSAKTAFNKLPRNTALPLDSFQDEVPELLPPFPVLSDAAFLIREPPPQEERRRLQEPSAFRLDLKPLSPSDRSCASSSSSLESPGSSSPAFLDDDFDTESILDEEVGEGIDSIMGNLSMNADGGNNEETDGHQTYTNPYLRSLIGLRTGGKYDFGFRLRYNRTMHQALRCRDEGEWWRTPAVPVGEIVPQFKSSSAPSAEKKKKKKKVEKNGTTLDVHPNAATITGNTKTGTATTATTDSNSGKAPALGLKLNHEEVLKAWSGTSMFSDCPDSPDFSAEALAKLSDIDLFGDVASAGGVREASVQRYKEKRRSRLFSKKIRYQVRKVNADSRPRMQGRFVRRPSLLQQAIEEEISQ